MKRWNGSELSRLDQRTFVALLLSIIFLSYHNGQYKIILDYLCDVGFFAYWVIFLDFCHLRNFFQNQLFLDKKIQVIQIKFAILSGVIWVQAVCKEISADDTSRQSKFCHITYNGQ